MSSRFGGESWGPLGIHGMCASRGHPGAYCPPPGLEPKRLDWGRMKKLGGGEAGMEAIMVEIVAQEGCKDEKRDQARPCCSQNNPSFLPLRVCSVRSVDGSPTTAFTVLECEGSRRLGSRPRRYLLTGQANGSLAMWDLTTAMDGLGQAPGTPCPTPILPQAAQTHPEPHSTSSFIVITLPKSLPLWPLSLPSNPSLPLFYNPSQFLSPVS